MLLKALDEVRRAPDPAAAMDMTLIRLAYAADLPGPEEALRALRSEAGPSGDEAPRPGRAPASGCGGASAARAPLAHPEALPAPKPGAAAMAEPRCFEDVVRLAEERRDIGLKFDLEKYVRPISFRTGALVFEAAPGAPSTLSHRLVARLKEWTGQPWLVACEGGGGAETLLERQTRERGDAHAEALTEPFIQAVLASFPGTEILEVRQMATPQAPVAEDGAGRED
jgi:DNA polymerase-3 subunit gamma/tau